MKRLILIGCLVAATGCAGAHGSIGRNGYLHVYGDEAGWRAYNDGKVGLITSGKSTPDAVTDYRNLRDKQEDTKVQIHMLGLGGFNQEAGYGDK